MISGRSARVLEVERSTLARHTPLIHGSHHGPDRWYTSSPPLDGVIDAPTWTFDFPFDPKMGEAIGGVMGGCTALLLGHLTFEMFAPAWSARTAAEDPGAPFMNDSPKYVIASGPPSGSSGGTRRSSDPMSAAAIRALKDREDGGIYVSGSGTLVRAMWPTGSSTSCTSSSTPSPWAPVPGCSTTRR